MGDYRVAGAADCIAAPVDIVSLNQTIQRIVRVSGRGRPVSSRAPNNFRFAGLGFYLGRNLLNGSAGNTIDLTTSEARLLTHFVSRPWALCTRSEIGELPYGPEHSVGDRAIDVVVRAAEWYRQAAEQGVATAQLRLGFLYLSGEGVVRDPEAGVAWLRRAVEVGDPEAQTALGMLYARGESVDRGFSPGRVIDPTSRGIGLSARPRPARTSLCPRASRIA
jgi:hypothetical protein